MGAIKSIKEQVKEACTNLKNAMFWYKEAVQDYEKADACGFVSEADVHEFMSEMISRRSDVRERLRACSELLGIGFWPSDINAAYSEMVAKCNMILEMLSKV